MNILSIIRIIAAVVSLIFTVLTIIEFHKMKKHTKISRELYDKARRQKNKEKAIVAKDELKNLKSGFKLTTFEKELKDENS